MKAALHRRKLYLEELADRLTPNGAREVRALQSTAEALEEAQGATDRLDALVHSLRLPVDDATHVRCLRAALPEILAELRGALAKAGVK